MNAVPTASFTATPSGSTVACDATASRDPDGTIASYAWTVGLTVTDDRGATASTSRSVTVGAANAPPVPTLLEQSNGLTAPFWGDRSTDPDGTVVAHAWTSGGGTTGTGATTTHAYCSAGTYPVPLTLTDDDGATAVLTRAVSVYPSGTRPTQAQWLADVSAAIDGRSADAGGTRNQLTAAGYRVDSLCFLDPAAGSTQASKTACRAAWVAQGHTIVASVGNRPTDLDGSNSGRQFLLPDYAFPD